MNRSASLTMRLNLDDNVIVARVEISQGMEIPEEKIICKNRIPFGHKLATAAIKKDDPIRKYGQIIGFASCDIAPGEHVHTHNVMMKEFTREHDVGVDAEKEMPKPEKDETFMGIVRSDGRVATRNYIGVISPVNCSATVTRHVADLFRGDALADFPNVDGVVPIYHGEGCGIEIGGGRYNMIMSALAGYARHPNFVAVLTLGLGCEDCNVDAVLEIAGLEKGPNVQSITIQDVGGTPKTVEKAAGIIRDMLPEANRVKRQPVPAGHLVLGLQCGGSDAYSGITANPGLGAASDRVVYQGGTVILGETPEIYGAEHLLTRRAVSPEVAEKLIELIKWWEDYAAKNNAELNNNPTLGNKEGGLTTILEKSLGAAAKGGTTNLMEVYKYAETVTSKGLVFMDSPGYDPPSNTGIVAGGANILCFTTGRGSAYGCKPVPSIKLASNSSIYHHMEDDMDVNCGAIVDGEMTMDEMGEHIFRMILDVASGKQSKSEIHGYGDSEFAPWVIGAMF
jgi:altronate hydrolase